MIVVVSERARADLAAIGEFIAADNPRRAVSFVREIIECCEQLGEMPKRFQLIQRRAHADIRRRPFRNYLIFYKVRAKTIEIVRVLNGAQDYRDISFPD